MYKNSDPTMYNLRVKNLSKKYLSTMSVIIANKSISFEARTGDIIWIHGRSGSEKTTLMNMITTLDIPAIEEGHGIFSGDS